MAVSREIMGGFVGILCDVAHHCCQKCLFCVFYRRVLTHRFRAVLRHVISILAVDSVIVYYFYHRLYSHGTISPIRVSVRTRNPFIRVMEKTCVHKNLRSLLLQAEALFEDGHFIVH